MKWLLVTGGGHGIGREIARQAAGAGYAVAIWDHNGDTARAVAAELATATHVSQLDVTDEAAVLAAVDELPAVPDAVVNNAGAVRFGAAAGPVARRLGSGYPGQPHRVVHRRLGRSPAR